MTHKKLGGLGVGRGVSIMLCSCSYCSLRGGDGRVREGQKIRNGGFDFL